MSSTVMTNAQGLERQLPPQSWDRQRNQGVTVCDVSLRRSSLLTQTSAPRRNAKHRLHKFLDIVEGLT